MNHERIDRWCEKGILGLVLVILVFGPLAIGGVRPGQFLVIEALTLGVMALWGVRWWVGPRPQLLWPPVCWAVLAFVAYAVVRYLQADIEYVARWELIRILVYAFLFFAILNNLHGQESTQIIALTMVFLGMAISFYAVFQFMSKSPRVWTMPSEYPGRASGTYICPNNLAGFLEMLVPLGLGYALMGRLPHVMKIILGYASVVMLAGIGTTLSRGGWLATTLSLAVLCGVLLFQRHYRIKALVLAVALVAGGFWLVPKVPLLQERVQNVSTGHIPDDMRFSIWAPAIQMWRDHFWWGTGPAHFDYRFREYRPPLVQSRPDFAHNDYLNTLADWGVAGTALVASAWVLVYWGVFGAWKSVRGPLDDFARKKSNKQAFATGAAVGLLAMLLHSATDFNMHIPANAILAVALMALLSSQQRCASERYWFNLRLVSKCAATLVLLAGLAYLGYEGWRGAREDLWLHRAMRTPAFSYMRIAALEKAVEAEPMNFATTYAIGECYRTKSFNSESEEPGALAGKAMEWYQRGMKLDPYDGYNWLRYGMCLDKFGPDEGPQKEAEPYYKRADELDPNGYYMSANIGWHYMQTGDYAAARSWLERSRRLEWQDDNEIAINSLPVVERLLKEEAEKKK